MPLKLWASGRNCKAYGNYYAILRACKWIFFFYLPRRVLVVLGVMYLYNAFSSVKRYTFPV